MIYEVINLSEVRKMPILQFKLSKHNPICIVNDKNKSIIKFDLSEHVVKDKLNVNSILSELQIRADKISLRQVKLSKNDKIFLKN